MGDVVSPRDTVTQKMSVTPYTFKPTYLIAPSLLIGIGAAGNHFKGWKDLKLLERKDSVTRFHLDDYMEWGLLGWVFVCDLMGEEKHNWVDQLLLLTLAEGLNGGMVQGIKRLADETRPDGGIFSFPSGHTANAFLGAHLAYKEFRHSSPALAYSGYLMAAFVAGSRVYNNRHWVADVFAGAGVGILSVELAYLIYFPIRNAIARNVNARASRNLVVAPTLNGGHGAGLYVSFAF
ncbi:phosphatase PAP2 family protein [Parabacteroides sp. OttesenSCG-928-N08]|nr:phosphatase PAP2 family protein [Parabacteroides sp. OttesenSCG-928-N08]